MMYDKTLATYISRLILNIKKVEDYSADFKNLEEFSSRQRNIDLLCTPIFQI